jgi:hypothetical protein
MAFSPREIEEISRHFAALTAKVPLRPITDEREYDEAVRVLNALLDAIRLPRWPTCWATSSGPTTTFISGCPTLLLSRPVFLSRVAKANGAVRGHRGR